MTLSAADVSAKTFTPVRLREGYEMAEVDDFLDQVEATVSGLTDQLASATAENADLHSQVVELTARTEALTADVDQLRAAAAAGATAAQVADSELSEAWATERAELHAQLAELRDQLADARTDAADTVVAPVVDSDRDLPAFDLDTDQVRAASQSAARLLEIATRNAEEVVAEARAVAEDTVEHARTEAQHLLEAANATAEQVRTDAEEARAAATVDLHAEVETLTGKVEELKSFEDEYRARLRHDLTGFLQALSAATVEVPEPADATDTAATVATVEDAVVSASDYADAWDDVDPDSTRTADTTDPDGGDDRA